MLHKTQYSNSIYKDIKERIKIVQFANIANLTYGTAQNIKKNYPLFSIGFGIDDVSHMDSGVS